MTAPELPKLPEGWVLEEDSHPLIDRPSFTLRRYGARICYGYNLVPTHYEADEVKAAADAVLEKYRNDFKAYNIAISEASERKNVERAEQRRWDAICAVFGGRKT